MSQYLGHRTTHESDSAPAVTGRQAARQDRGAAAPDACASLIVGIGASAGGLEAIGDLLEHLCGDSFALVIVQHMQRHRKSLLGDLLAKRSTLEVRAAADGVRLAANVVYVIRPNTNLSLEDGLLRVKPLPKDGPPRPIDFFFHALAADQKERAMGVVLSGTGDDGARGLQAIKAAGGGAIVQTPSTAAFGGMPERALEQPAVDDCRSPQEIAEALQAWSRGHARVGPTSKVPASPGDDGPFHQQDEGHIAELLAAVGERFRKDLSLYKTGTLYRRIHRRMQVRGVNASAHYLALVRDDAQEMAALFRDLLIVVTSFFRDPPVFEQLTRAIFPKIIENKRATSSPLRIWVPACATGEEAYSLAMCLVEALDACGPGPSVQIFATDIEAQSISRARQGRYSLDIGKHICDQRLGRFFVRGDEGYQVCRQLRDMVTFSLQDVVRDAPFSRIDLISCRNLMIYLRPATQQRLLGTFNYALNPQGFLLLGASEHLGDVPHYFSSVSCRHKIFARRDSWRQPTAALPTGVSSSLGAPIPRQGRPAVALGTLVDRRLLEAYAPPGVVVDEKLEVLQFRGDLRHFMVPTPGAASFHVLRLVHIDLRIHLERLLHQAMRGRRRVRQEVRFQEEGERRTVVVDIMSIDEPHSGAAAWLVLFCPVQQGSALSPSSPAASSTAAGGDIEADDLPRRLAELEHDLGITRDYLQTVVSENEAASRELKSANEEMQAGNEELQSTNEELETSKEEMQSANEELLTVNDELQGRLQELGRTRDDLHNVLESVDSFLLLLDGDLVLRRFSRPAGTLLGLAPGDLGRSIDILERLGGNLQLGGKVRAVLDSCSVYEEEVVIGLDAPHALHIAPYRSEDRAVRGAVVRLSPRPRPDLSGETSPVRAPLSLAPVVAAVSQPLVAVDQALRVVWANDHFLRRFAVSEAEVVHRGLEQLEIFARDQAALASAVRAALQLGAPFERATSARWGDKVSDGGGSPARAARRLRLRGSRVIDPQLGALILISLEDEIGR